VQARKSEPDTCFFKEDNHMKGKRAIVFLLVSIFVPFLTGCHAKGLTLVRDEAGKEQHDVSISAEENSCAHGAVGLGH